MKRRTTLSQPSKRRQSAARGAAQSAQSPAATSQGIVAGRTVIEVTAGQLAGLRGVVLEAGAKRWSIQLEVAARGVLLSIDPKWVRIIPADSA